MEIVEIDQNSPSRSSSSSASPPRKRAKVASSSSLPPPPSAGLKQVASGELSNGSAHDQRFRSRTERVAGQSTDELKEKNKQQLDDESVGESDKPYLSSTMYEYLRKIEEKTTPLHNYMEIVQKNNFTAHQREILVEWVMDVTVDFKLAINTLYFSVSYIDRFLSSHFVRRNRLQLLGLACISVAS